MTLLVVGVSHRTAPVSLLDRVALTCEWADKALGIATPNGFDASANAPEPSNT